MRQKEFDVRDLPSWKYFAWGLINGLFLGIVIKQGIDISEVGILSQVLENFKPIFQSVNMSTTWISLTIFFLGLIGILSLIIEIIVIYKRGWPQRIISMLGFVSFLALIIGFNTIGIFFLLGGILMVVIFPDE